jgi:hypothetical protein
VLFLRAGLRAADFFLAVAAFLVPRLRVAAAFLPAATRLVDLRRAGLRAAVFLAAVFRRVVVRFLVAAAFFAAVFLRAVVRFLVAAAFLPAATRLVDLRLAGLRAAVFFRAAVFRAAIPFPLSFVDSEGVLGYDAIRLRRRRSRSLIPPHTPYRSSRRSA